ncbi:alginate lyase family protein [Pendulispora albinea]|uniref:Alginate lyase family protein n=1 Tax=Pendulispora albinea TaxID=2741071 RepID=A0ABZ2LYC3_9BACT
MLPFLRGFRSLCTLAPLALLAGCSDASSFENDTGIISQKTESAGSTEATEAPTTAAPAVFTHPGVLVSRPQLDFVRGKVSAGAQPWANASSKMLADPLLSQSRAPKPRAIVECGPYSNPNYGCTDERQDALAAYGNALAWYITQDSRYANKAIAIMDAWSGIIQNHTNSNAPLQTGWAGASWARAAEIIRHTYGSWPAAGVNRFASMLRDVYLPKLINGSNSNGNWELTMMEAAVGISVFLEDRASYDRAVSIFRVRVPAYIYLTSDGALPKTKPGSGVDTREEIIRYWQNQSTFVDGLSQETCRDFTHTGYGLASISNFAETARHQGLDLHAEIKDRLRFALGFHAKYELGEAPPSWLCGGKLTRGIGPVLEVGFNALGNRLGITMPNTQKLVEQQRPAGTNVLFIGWETLTHAANPY